MRKKLPMSALISGLLAAPVLGAAPVMAESRAPVVVEQGALGGGAGTFPAEMPAEVGERMRRWVRGEKLNAYGMQELQGKLARQSQARVAALLERANAMTPSFFEPETVTATALYPVHFMQAEATTAVPPLPAEKVPFLGVAVAPLDPVLQEQLNLGRGMGLMVEFVVKDSPAEKAGIKVHDVLQKLDDQWLVNPDQFQVLVRSKKAGDSVSVTVIHAGKTAAVKATLAEREVTANEPMQIPMQQMMMGSNVAGGGGSMPQMITISPGGVTQQMVGTSWSVDANGTTTRKVIDDQNEITLTRDKVGKEKVLVKDREGHTLYDNDPAGLDKSELSRELKGKIEALRSSPNSLTITIGEGDGRGGAALTAQKITMERKDDQHEITLLMDGKGRSVTVREMSSGKVIYQGGVEEGDMKKMPAGVAEKIGEMLKKVK